MFGTDCALAIPHHGAVRLFLSITAIATAIYVIVEELARVAGYEMIILWVPVPCTGGDFWLVAPGAGLLGFLLYKLLLRVPYAHVASGAGLGALLGPINACLAVLLSLVQWQMEGLLGISQPWPYGFGGLFEEWVRTLPLQVVLSLPVAIPCGLVVGALLGVAAARARKWATAEGEPCVP